MIKLLVDNRLRLPFVITAISYLLGRVKIKGIGFGVAALLLAGLAIGSLDPNLKLPDKRKYY